MSSRARLYTESDVPLERFKEGWVHYWPEYVQEKRRPPLRPRARAWSRRRRRCWGSSNRPRRTTRCWERPPNKNLSQYP